MSSPLSGHEQVCAEPLAALAQQLATVTAERDRFARERDEYKSRAEWLHKQLERLRDEAKTPRERVDPRQIQLVFEPFAQALLALATSGGASALGSNAASSEEGENEKKRNKRKATPHGRRI